MARNRTSQLIKPGYFQWLLAKRNGVYQADGRRNKPSTGRHSLNTKNREKAMSNLTKLDLQIAAQRGLIDAAALQDTTIDDLPFDLGVDAYLKHVGRPRVLKGASPVTVKRYRAVFIKALPYFLSLGLACWNQLKKRHVESYVAWLDGEGYLYRTEFFEANTIKQAMKFFIASEMLPPTCRLNLPMDKPTGTDTYCYREVEVAGMVRLCRTTPELDWLADVIIALAHTGMRISELATLAWACIDFDRNMIVVDDESRSRPMKGRRARTNKSRRSRCFPIHPTLRAVLDTLHREGISGYVFKAAKGGMLHDGNLRKIFVEQVLQPLQDQFPTPEDEIGFADGRLHSFRHYFCSWCSTSGVKEQTLMSWLGHRHSGMVGHYYQLHDEPAQMQMQKLGTIVGLDAV